ncbi:MAG: flagellar FliJ family protein [Bacillota bacterium]
MKKFVFTLQTLYDVTISEEKQLKLKMKKIEERLTALVNGQRELERRFSDAKTRSAKEMLQGVSSDRLVQYGRYFEYLTDAMRAQQKKIHQTENERARCLQEQIAIKKKIRTYEKLRKSQYEAYLQEAKLEAEKEIGDIVSYQTATK